MSPRVQRQNLPAAIADHLVSVGIAGHQQAGSAGLVAVAHDVVRFPERADFVGQVEDRLLITLV